MIKELVLITIGSPLSLGTWSGVPYFLLNQIEKKGIKVNYINLEPNKYIKIIYNTIFLPLLSLLVKNGELSIYRTVFFRIYQYFIFRTKLCKYKNVDVVIGLSYNLMIPRKFRSVLFSDWPFSYDLEKKGINIGRYQRYHLCWENRCLKNASHVISLFPTCAKYINSILGENKAISLGVNVVNNLSSEPDKQLISKKIKRKRIVFIGRKHYLKGAIALITSYSELKKVYPNLCIDIIGLTKKDIEEYEGVEMLDGIKLWGYLDKGNTEQCNQYYNILSNASLYVNTTPGWVGYTSMIEAMYYYTPVVVYPCTEFIDEFGDNINWGIYCQTEEQLVTSIISILSNKDRFQMFCENAHDRVSEYTWSNFTDRLLMSITETA